jgi:hypothetical protein
MRTIGRYSVLGSHPGFSSQTGKVRNSDEVTRKLSVLRGVFSMTFPFTMEHAISAFGRMTIRTGVIRQPDVATVVTVL